MLSPEICTSLSFRNGAEMVCSVFMKSEKLKPVGNIKSLDPSPIHRQKAEVSFVILNVSAFQQYLPTVSKKISVVFSGLSSKPAERARERKFNCRGKSTEGKGNDTRES